VGKKRVPWFIFGLTRTAYYRGWVESHKRVAGQPNINGQEYSSLLIPEPPLPAQQKFGMLTRNIESILVGAAEAAENLETTFSTMLQQAFSGQLTAKWREAHMKELLELKKISALAGKLQDAGFDVTVEAVAKGDEKSKAMYRVIVDAEEKDVASIAELLEAIKDAGRKGATIQRYKGLGEMNPQQLWETTMDPQNRKLLRVKLDANSTEADDVFTVLMGDKVEPRRQFIESHASEVQNLDI
jgi:DNA gyrase subunit B